MAFLVSSLPPVQCFIKREFLYDHQKGHGELEPCVWMSLKAIKGQAFRIESLLPNYGALYDKLPLHAYVWKEGAGDLPLDFLQLWDCMGYHFTIVEKSNLRGLKMKFFGKDRQFHFGDYLFTVDFCSPDFSVLDTTFTETAAEHKSFNFIRLDNGQFAAQPNNRCLFYDQSLVSGQMKMPDFKVCTKIYTVENTAKWSARDSDDFFYQINETT